MRQNSFHQISHSKIYFSTHSSNLPYSPKNILKKAKEIQWDQHHHIQNNPQHSTEQFFCKCSIFATNSRPNSAQKLQIQCDFSDSDSENLKTKFNQIYLKKKITDYEYSLFKKSIQKTCQKKIKQILLNNINLFESNKHPFQICQKFIKQREKILVNIKQLLETEESICSKTEFVDSICRLIAHLRILTIRVIESVQIWRQFHNNFKLPFMYQNNVNYLLKLRSDSHFINLCSLRNIMPFSQKYDPFFIFGTKQELNIHSLDKNIQQSIQSCFFLDQNIKKKIQICEKVIIRECYFSKTKKTNKQIQEKSFISPFSFKRNSKNNLVSIFSPQKQQKQEIQKHKTDPNSCKKQGNQNVLKQQIKFNTTAPECNYVLESKNNHHFEIQVPQIFHKNIPKHTILTAKTQQKIKLKTMKIGFVINDYIEDKINCKIDYFIEPKPLKDYMFHSYFEDYLQRIPSIISEAFIKNQQSFLENLYYNIDFRTVEIREECSQKIASVCVFGFPTKYICEIYHFSVIQIYKFSHIFNKFLHFIWKNFVVEQIHLSLFQLNAINQNDQIKKIFNSNQLEFDQNIQKYKILKQKKDLIEIKSQTQVQKCFICVQISLLISKEEFVLEPHMKNVNQIQMSNQYVDISSLLIVLLTKIFTIKILKKLSKMCKNLKEKIIVKCAKKLIQNNFVSNIIHYEEFEQIKDINQLLLELNMDVYMCKDYQQNSNIQLGLINSKFVLPNFFVQKMENLNNQQYCRILKIEKGSCWLIKSLQSECQLVVFPLENNDFGFFLSAQEYLELDLQSNQKDLFVFLQLYLSNIEYKDPFEWNIWFPCFKKKMSLLTNCSLFNVFNQNKIIANTYISIECQEKNIYEEAKMHFSVQKQDFFVKAPFIYGVLNNQIDKIVNNIPLFAFFIQKDDLI